MIPPVAAVDASVAVKWVVGEAGSDAAVLLRESRLFAPDLWIAECANVLWKKVRRAELTAAEAEVAAMALESADVEMVPTRPLMARAVVWPLNSSTRHTTACIYWSRRPCRLPWLQSIRDSSRRYERRRRVLRFVRFYPLPK